MVRICVLQAGGGATGVHSDVVGENFRKGSTGISNATPYLLIILARICFFNDIVLIRLAMCAVIPSPYHTDPTVTLAAKLNKWGQRKHTILIVFYFKYFMFVCRLHLRYTRKHMKS